MTRIQISTGVSQETRRKADALLQQYGTLKEVVTTAIDHLYQGHEGDMIMDAIKAAWNDLGADVSERKFSMICKEVFASVETSPHQVANFIDADWNEGQEHIDWLASASVLEIADWVIAGLR